LAARNLVVANTSHSAVADIPGEKVSVEEVVSWKRAHVASAGIEANLSECCCSLASATGKHIVSGSKDGKAVEGPTHLVMRSLLEEALWRYAVAIATQGVAAPSTRINERRIFLQKVAAVE
jgi:hypothetical protein